MRFDSLHLQAFGPFTGMKLDFPLSSGDLHLIHGPNEAGKSSLLRAIGDLFYEIPARSADNFLHAHKDLRIGAELRGRAGDTLRIQRRKGNRNTLLDGEGEVLPDDTLASWLGHVDRESFTTMFGLASDQLRQGAAALLRGEGDLGKALFSASLGGTPVHKILESIEGEARQFYAGRSKARLKESVEIYKREMKAAVDHNIKPEAWEAAEKAVAAAMQQQAAIEQERAEKIMRSQWLQRCLDALPTLAKWRARESDLAALPVLPVLPVSFASEARAALLARRQAESGLRHAEEEHSRLQGLLLDCKPREAVLNREAEIESLRRVQPMHGDWHRRRKEKGAAIASMEAVLAAGMRGLGLAAEATTLERLRLPAADLAVVKELAAALTGLEGRLETSEARMREKAYAVRILQSRLDGLMTGDVARLREAMVRSAPAVEAQRTLDIAEAATAKAEREMKSQLRFIPGMPQEPAVAYGLTLPSRASLLAMRDELEKIAQERLQASKERTTLVGMEAKLRQELEWIEQGSELPSVQSLAAARAQRNTLWNRLKEAAAAGDLAVFQSLADEYEVAQSKADSLSDLLRDHADQVAKADERRSVRAVNATCLAQIDQRLSELSDTVEAWQTRWEALWLPSGLRPGTPEEMLERREGWVEFRRLYDHWIGATEELERRRRLIADAHRHLAEVLQDTSGCSFAVLLDLAQRTLAKADQDDGARAALTQQMAEARLHSAESENEARRLKTQRDGAAALWRNKCAELQLNLELSPGAGLELIEQRRTLVQSWDALQTLRVEATLLDGQISAFEQDCAALASALEIEAADAETAASSLWKELEIAREGRANQKRLQAEQRVAEAKQREASLQHEEAAAKLTALLAQAGLNNESELEPLLGQIENYGRLAAERDRLRESLEALARGENLETFAARVQMENPAQLEMDKASLDAEVETLSLRRDEAVKVTLEAGRQLEFLKQAGDAAALHRQNAELSAAALRSGAARYLRLRLATHFLEKQIERFRKENQAPLMKRASTLFNQFTLGRFDGLTTDFVDDQPVIGGQRGGLFVPVVGMSEGTRDQLYLSLRLAAIERHLENHEPLPLILDDLLITFDDRRAAAILPVLAALSAKTQVLLFTHHDHLVELARRTLAPGQFTVHELGFSS